MRYLSVAEIAEKWNISERSVRNYCAHGRVEGAFLTGKTWNIPESAEKPERTNKKKEEPKTLLDILQNEKKNNRKYNSIGSESFISVLHSTTLLTPTSFFNNTYCQKHKNCDYA